MIRVFSDILGEISDQSLPPLTLNVTIDNHHHGTPYADPSAENLKLIIFSVSVGNPNVRIARGPLLLQLGHKNLSLGVSRWPHP